MSVSRQSVLDDLNCLVMGREDQWQARWNMYSSGVAGVVDGDDVDGHVG